MILCSSLTADCENTLHNLNAQKKVAIKQQQHV
jgi:hypothetical protein